MKNRGKCPTCYVEDAPDRFWTYIVSEDGHEFWTGGLTDNGYGGFHLGGGKYVRAHIYAWELRHGPVPDGMELGHTCKFKHCILHVRPVTHLQNVREGRVGTPDVNKKISEARTRMFAERTLRT